MTNDSAIPNIESNTDKEVESISALSDVKSDVVAENGELFADGSLNLTKSQIQVQIKSDSEKISIILPAESQLSASENSTYEIWQQLKVRLLGGDRHLTPKSKVHLVANDRLLDSRQLQDLAATLGEIPLYLESVATSRRQTAIAAAALGYDVEQLKLGVGIESNTNPSPLLEALYLEMTIRSGVEIRHQGNIIILGDVNPGGNVVADGDILIWGRLRGVAHAGAQGNPDCQIMALQMEPTQLRIADAVARAPEQSPTQFYPEVAYVTSQGIRIARASDYSRKSMTSDQ